ncbi:hypothetical protein N7465_006465 [Penicillium sp. CMV-2018d]|nr:hypothetical protein N7465_006465 [Penicillium sp. CMV-2018d]
MDCTHIPALLRRPSSSSFIAVLRQFASRHPASSHSFLSPSTSHEDFEHEDGDTEDGDSEGQGEQSEVEDANDQGSRDDDIRSKSVYPLSSERVVPKDNDSVVERNDEDEFVL